MCEKSNIIMDKTKNNTNIEGRTKSELLFDKKQIFLEPNNKEFFKLFNKLAEQNILNSMFYDEKCCYKGINMLVKNDFFFDIHKNLFESIQSFTLDASFKRDIFLFIEFLKTKYQNNLKKIGNLDYVFSLFNVLVDTTYFDKYVKIIVNKSKIRELNQLSYKIINSLKFEKKDLNLEDIEERLLKIFSRTKSTDLDLIQNFCQVAETEVTKLLNKDYRFFVSSGFNNLDSVIIGFFESELTVLAGRPGAGKTAFALNLAVNIIKKKKIVVFINLEMTNTQMFQRLLSLNTGISIYSIRSSEITEKELLKLKQKIDSQEYFKKLFVIDAPGISIKKIKFILHYLLLEQKKIDIIILDYLQLLVSHNKLSKHEDLTNITIDLKNIARFFNVPIIALSQLSRESTKADKPRIEHLKYSGGIEENFDNIFMLNPIKQKNEFDFNLDINFFERDRNIELIIGKQRNGPLGSVFFKFKVSHGRFIEQTN